MRQVDLRGIDLNLLVVLGALLDDRSVTRAARRLGMSQPAASRALLRLRALFRDPLLVEARGGYVLSARAEALRPVLAELLSGIGGLLEARPFDPATATGRVRLVMADLEASTLGPHLLAQLTREAPALDLDIVPPRTALFEALDADGVDALVGVIDAAPSYVKRRALYDDAFSTLMRIGHPAASGALTMERFLALDHVVVSITGTGQAPVDEALARMGLARRVRMRLPSFLGALEIVARSDLVVTFPSSLAEAGSVAGRFVAQPPPLDLGRFTTSLAWHARRHDEPRHVWLRRAIAASATGMKAAGAP